MDTLLRGYGMQHRWTFPGMIIPFSGTFGGEGNRFPIPLGEDSPDMHWCLCDGTTTNGLPVPDLRGRMIRGASDSVPAGSTGGSETHSHSMSGTVGKTTLTEAQMPSHEHLPSNKTNFVTGGGNGEADICSGPQFESYSTCRWTDTAGKSASHTHALDGASGEASGLPPYYALAYIMRCA